MKIICPECSANLDIPVSPVHTCEYCGVVIQVDQIAGPGGKSITGEELPEETKRTLIFKDHYIVRANYTDKEAQTIMQDWIKKLPQAPQDFENSATITRRELKFYPIWVGEFTISSRYAGIDDWPEFHHPAYDRNGWYERVSYHQRTETGFVLREYQIPLMGLQTPPKYLRSYVVPTTSKEYFDITHVKELGGIVLDSTYGVEDAKRTLRLSAFNRQLAEMRKEVHTVTRRDDDMEEGDIFYIQFPVYEFDFSYNKKKYHAYIDGSTGRIIHIDVPISRKFKLFSLIAGLGQIGLGVALGILGLVFPDNFIFGGLSAGAGLIVFGSLLLSMSAKKGAQEKQA